MNVLSRSFERGLPLIAMLCAFGGNSFAGSISASATFTDVQLSPSEFQYSISLDNTGTTTIGTLWFGWIPGAGFLSTAPTSIQSPTGWSDTLTNSNSAIQWKTTSSLLAAGQSLSGFMFDSTETPAQLLGPVASGMGVGDPMTTSFVYIAVPLADPGFQLAATPAGAAPSAPEPGTILLAIAGLCATAVFGKLKTATSR